MRASGRYVNLPPCAWAMLRAIANPRRISRAYPKRDTCRQQLAAFTGGMTSDSEPARTMAKRTPASLLVCLVVVIAALVALGNQVLDSSASTVTRTIGAQPNRHVDARRGADGMPGPSGRHHAALGEADGAVPDNTTVFDNAVPAVANLDPGLLSAVRQAAAAAAADGVGFFVDSGWRSPAYQQHLLDEAVSKYGSLERAQHWVATPNTSAHVKGEAIDIGHSNAAAWLSEHGAQYGLCRIYGNEPWHFELRGEAIDQGCPSVYPDPTQDPRMERQG
jgi:zinc D-Ala-D-Ala carboxypeptidase